MIRTAQPAMTTIVRMMVALGASLLMILGVLTPVSVAEAASATLGGVVDSGRQAIAGVEDVPLAGNPDLPRTDGEFITAIIDRFGVEASREQLQVVLDDEVLGEWVREQVKTAIYGDTVLGGGNAAVEVLNDMLADMFNTMTGNVVPKVTAQIEKLKTVLSMADSLIHGEQPDSSGGALLSDSLIGFGIDKAKQLTPQLAPVWSQLDAAQAFSAVIKKYTSWGVKAFSQQPWQALISAYHEQRSTQSPEQARQWLESGDLSLYYRPTIDMLTRDLTQGSEGQGWAANAAVAAFAALVPTSALFQSRAELFDALESTHYVLLLGKDQATQASIGAAITAAALALTLDSGTNRVFGVQTSRSTITVVNASPFAAENVVFHTGRGDWGTIGRIESGAVVQVSDPGGYSLDGDGSVTYSLVGVSSAHVALVDFSETAWAKGAALRPGTAPTDLSVSLDALVVRYDFEAHWDFGDGVTAIATVGAQTGHSYLCASTYRPELVAASIGVAFPLADLGDFTVRPPFAVDWHIAGMQGYRVAPFSTAELVPDVLPAAEGTSLTWQIQDAFGSRSVSPSQDGRTRVTFGLPALTSVTLAVSYNSGQCTAYGDAKNVTVGTNTSWVKLPSVIWWNQTLDGNVGGYWTDTPVTIASNAKLSIVNSQLRSSARTMFLVAGALEVAASTAASTSDPAVTQPPDVSPMSDSFTFANASKGGSLSITDSTLRGGAIGGTNSSIALTRVTSLNTSTAVYGTGLRSLAIDGSTFQSCFSGLDLRGGGTAPGALTVRGTLLDCESTGIIARDRAQLQVSDSHFDVDGYDLNLAGAAWRTSVERTTSSKGAVTASLAESPVIGPTTLDSDILYDANATILQGSRVVVPSGTVLRVSEGGRYSIGTGFMLSGRLTLDGTAEHPVVFTARWDDAAGTVSGGWPGSESFAAVGMGGSGVLNATHVVMRHGAYFAYASLPAGWPYWGTPAGSGGRMDVSDLRLGKAGISISKTELAQARFSRVSADNSQFDISTPTTDVVIEDSDFGTGGPHVAAKSLSVVRSTFDGLVATEMDGVSIRDNRLTNGETITLVGKSAGATVLGNRAADGDGGRVILSGEVPDAELSSDLPYHPSNVVVSGVLTIDPGVVVKTGYASRYTQVGLQVRGEVRVRGTTEKPVTFTSLWDDSIGGDTDGVPFSAYDQSDPSLMASAAFGIVGSGRVSLEHATVRNLGYVVMATAGRWWEWSTGAVADGQIEIADSDLGFSRFEIYNARLSRLAIMGSTSSGPEGWLNIIGENPDLDVSIEDSDLGLGGVYATSVGSVSVKGSRFSNFTVTDTPDTTFTGNDLTGIERITLYGSSMGAVLADNAAADGSGGAVAISGQAPEGTVLRSDLPYVPSSVSVLAGRTLTVAAGTIVKSPPGWPRLAAAFTVTGTIVVDGTAQSPVRFAALSDDSVGGDTDQSTASGQAADQTFVPLWLYNGGRADVRHAESLGGTYFAYVPRSNGEGQSSVSIQDSRLGAGVRIETAVTGLSLLRDVFDAAAAVEVTDQVTGPLTLEGNRFGNVVSITATPSGPTSIVRNDFSARGFTSSTAMKVESNWWGSANGPGKDGAPSFDWVAGDADPWCIDATCAVLSDAPRVFTTVPVPGITGTVAVGAKVIAEAGAWAPSPSKFTYQWKRDGKSISGAVNKSYTLTSADAGTKLTVTITATKSGFTTASKTSSPASVPAFAFTSTPVPTIAGGTTVGSTLDAAAGAWAPTPTSLTYQWSRDGVAISGAMSSSYLLVAADAGRAITVTVVATKTGYVRTAKTSDPVAVAPLAFAQAPTPTLSGSGAVGSTLSVSRGTWDPAPDSFTYRWSRNGTPIPGATSATYKVTAYDAGTTLAVTVSGIRSGYATTMRTSAGTSILDVFDTVPVPTFTGSAVVGSKVVAVTGTWEPSPSKFSYQWKRDGKSISGATAKSYTLTAADAGASLTVTVTATRAGFASASKTSAAAVVAAPPFTAAPVPTIMGDAAVGAALAATTGTWNPVPSLLATQWNRDGVPIAGATSATYVVTSQDAGTSITATVTGSLAGYATTSRTSAAMAIPAAEFVTAPVPTVGGSVVVGGVITAASGAWSPTPATTTYQWNRDGTPIADATQNAYTLTAADGGTQISVSVTASVPGFVTTTRTSAAVTVPGAFTMSPVPTISGTLAVGFKVYADAGTWEPGPSKFTYQWKRDGKSISGAVNKSYTLAVADAGRTVTVTVTAIKTGFTSVSKTSVGVPIPEAPTMPDLQALSRQEDSAAPFDPSGYTEYSGDALADVLEHPELHIGEAVIAYSASGGGELETTSCERAAAVEAAPGDAIAAVTLNSVLIAAGSQGSCDGMPALAGDEALKLWIEVVSRSSIADDSVQSTGAVFLIRHSEAVDVRFGE